MLTYRNWTAKHGTAFLLRFYLSGRHRFLSRNRRTLLKFDHIVEQHDELFGGFFFLVPVSRAICRKQIALPHDDRRHAFPPGFSGDRWISQAKEYRLRPAVPLVMASNFCCLPNTDIRRTFVSTTFSGTSKHMELNFALFVAMLNMNRPPLYYGASLRSIALIKA